MTCKCPDETALAAFLDGGLDPAARGAIEAHLARCERCLDVVSAEARAALLEPPLPVPARVMARARAAVARPRVAAGWNPRRLLPAGALAAAVLLAAVLWRQGETVPGGIVETGPLGWPSGAPPEYRGPDTAAVVAPELTTPIEGATVPPGPVSLAWTPVPRSLGYDVQLMTEAGDPVWQSHVAATHVVALDPALVPGRTFYARVAAVLPDGRRVASAAVTLRIDAGP